MRSDRCAARLLSLSVVATALPVPASAGADAFWPPLLLETGRLDPWVVTFTLAFEAVAIRVAAAASWRRSFAASVLANGASFLVGFVVFYPVMRMDRGIQALVDVVSGPGAAIGVILLSIALSCTVETVVVSRFAGVRATGRFIAIISAANVVTTLASCVGLLLRRPWA